jgi:hypothetical protein
VEAELYEQISFAIRMLPEIVSITIPQHYKVDQWHRDLQQVANDLNFHEYIYWKAPEHIPGNQTDKIFLSFNKFDSFDVLKSDSLTGIDSL